MANEMRIGHHANYAGELAILAESRFFYGRGRGIMIKPSARVTAHDTNMMACHARGLISVGLGPDLAERLALRRMPGAAPGAKEPQFLVSVEAASCVDTGISAFDRADTIAAIGNPSAKASDLVSPGHVMPLLVQSGRGMPADLPEMALALVEAQMKDHAVAYCDILDEDGEVASFEYCRKLACVLNLPFIDAWAGRAGTDDAILDWEAFT